MAYYSLISKVRLQIKETSFLRILRFAALPLYTWFRAFIIRFTERVNLGSRISFI
jgi:hypothetical protein